MAKRVSLFVTCVVDQLFPRVGMAMAEVLERIGYQVDFPEDQTCCGQPAFNTGYRQEARQVARQAFEPRLMMTAAMAFFYIALTLNLTGVRLQDLRISDLRPSSLQRDFYSAKARVVRNYEGLRVVYELESRVRDLQRSSNEDGAAGSSGCSGSPGR